MPLVSGSSDTPGPPPAHPACGAAPETPPHSAPPQPGEVDRFSSALGNEDLTAIILQYAMYDREAQEKLTADRSLGLAHLYRPGKFAQEGVEVIGAGRAQVNGWYRCRDENSVLCYWVKTEASL